MGPKVRGKVADSEKDQSAEEMGVKLVQQIQAAQQTWFLGRLGLGHAPREAAGEEKTEVEGPSVYLEGLANVAVLGRRFPSNRKTPPPPPPTHPPSP